METTSSRWPTSSLNTFCQEEWTLYIDDRGVTVLPLQMYRNVADISAPALAEMCVLEIGREDGGGPDCLIPGSQTRKKGRCSPPARPPIAASLLP
jgi:hypothetical protein